MIYFQDVEYLFDSNFDFQVVCKIILKVTAGYENICLPIINLGGKLHPLMELFANINKAYPRFVLQLFNTVTLPEFPTKPIPETCEKFSAAMAFLISSMNISFPSGIINEISIKETRRTAVVGTFEQVFNCVTKAKGAPPHCFCYGAWVGGPPSVKRTICIFKIQPSCEFLLVRPQVII